MALNYQRIGWEDAPSTNTPIDAANLNHMDNGIVAVSNEFDRVIPGLEEIAQTVSPLLPNMSTMIQDISTLQGQTSALATQAQHILGNFATVEEGETASANYSTGQHVVLGDYLYKVIDDIAQGESFVENTNIEKTTVGSEVEGLKSEIDELNSNALHPSVTTSPVAVGTTYGYIGVPLPDGAVSGKLVRIDVLGEPAKTRNITMIVNPTANPYVGYVSADQLQSGDFDAIKKGSSLFTVEWTY